VWGSLLALLLITALNPVRLAITLLVISRPRPVQNLLAYAAGCLTGCIPGVVVPLTLLHVTPMFGTFADGLATSSTVRHIRIGLGVLALSIAAALTLHSLARQLDPKTPPAISRLLGRTPDGVIEGKSVFRKLLRRIQAAWENGSLWVAFLIGMFFGGVEPDVGLFLLAIIVASGATIGTQITAAIMFVVGVLAIVEVTLIGYLVAPEKTQEKVQLLHNWALTHRRKILTIMCAVAGVSLLASAIGH
jgi:hypothetical protein